MLSAPNSEDHRDRLLQTFSTTLSLCLSLQLTDAILGTLQKYQPGKQMGDLHYPPLPPNLVPQSQPHLIEDHPLFLSSFSAPLPFSTPSSSSSPFLSASSRRLETFYLGPPVLALAGPFPTSQPMANSLS